jgi:uncharacterized protein YifE (UPF0438 family)
LSIKHSSRYQVPSLKIATSHRVGKLQVFEGAPTMEADFLAAVITERDERKRRYMLTYREVLKHGDITIDEQEKLDQIDKQMLALNKECREKEIKLEPMCAANHDEYVVEMVDLVDREAKTFSDLTGQLRQLLREIKSRRAKALSGLDR